MIARPLRRQSRIALIEWADQSTAEKRKKKKRKGALIDQWVHRLTNVGSLLVRVRVGEWSQAGSFYLSIRRFHWLMVNVSCEQLLLTSRERT